MNPAAARRLLLDPELECFTIERPRADLRYAALRCVCRSRVFRVTGWPRVVSGRGGFFWRSFTRVWREARQRTTEGERIDSHFSLPLAIQCRECETQEMLFDDEFVPERVAVADRAAPREAYRCRACGRGHFEVVAGRSPEEASCAIDAVEVVVRCSRCRQQALVASSVRPDATRQARLDLLYGRR